MAIYNIFCMQIRILFRFECQMVRIIRWYADPISDIVTQGEAFIVNIIIIIIIDKFYLYHKL